MATAIAWMLASDSVVVMPPPTQEGWSLEGTLQPWVHYVPLASPDAVDATLAWLKAHDATEVPRIIANANAFIARRVRRRALPCAAPPAAGRLGPPTRAWRWSEARDGPKVDAENMRVVLDCIVDPRVAKALFEHAAEGLRAFLRAPAGSARGELREAAARAARAMAVDDARDVLVRRFKGGPVENMGRRRAR